MESAVVYDGLPISSGGAHGLGHTSARDALAAWLSFLEACTVASPIESYFDFPATPGLTVDGEVARLIEHQFPRSSSRLKRFPVPWERMEAALSLFESIEPQPTNQWGMAPVWLWCAADFRLRSPIGPGLWPGQDPDLFGDFQTPTGVTLGASSTRLVLQAKRSLGLSLSIPMATDADLDLIAPWLQAALPMTLSSKRWTRWTLTRDKRSYRGRKIVPGTRASR
ncbi:MAG TPA: hypothetical protein VFA11_17235 [Acidimicrobiales bacterium]|nr:hypothetical protein [Acidimicrobiales bacterium]